VDITPIFNFFFQQYTQYLIIDIFLELTAMLFGLISIWFAKRNSINVYPLGLISTGIYVYLLIKWGLLGDFLINVYYFIMSIYGWYFWSKRLEGEIINRVDHISYNEKVKIIFLAISSFTFVYLLYSFFNKWHDPFAWLDTITTSLFFVGMWLMARRKVENWIFWIIGDIISVPLYFYKGLTLTSFQYLIFTILAFQGYNKWKRIINKNQLIV